VCLHINWKAHAACDIKFIVKGEGFLKSQAVMYTGKVVISRSQNRCQIEMQQQAS